MSLYGWLVWVFLCFNVERTSSFPAYEIPMETETKSHSAITMEAIFRATAAYLDRMKLVNDTGQSPFLKVSNYFGSDRESFQRFIQIIQEISGYESIVKRDRASDSKYHVNGEQIEMAHTLIKQIRNRIVNFSTNSTIVKNNISLIREDVATILYIIQEFYSNTNWVELYGNIAYNEFGQDNDDLKPVAKTSEDTCTDCKIESGTEQCENNTIGSNLTSGYRSGQRITKPLRYQNGNGGKCSHGTPDDTSRNFTATGGIYKGRSIQSEAPHSYLHSAAAEAAVNATEYYLIDEVNGLLALIGTEAFRDMFGIHSREEIVKSSLTFVINVASSMADDISKIKKAIKKMISETTSSRFSPARYVLVTFSDLANLNTGNTTADPQIMLSWLDQLNVSVGGGCAESSMMGILKGIEMSNNNSKIFIITDASVTNASLKEEVVNGLREKKLKSVSIIAGNCSTKTRMDVHVAIATETGGKIYETTTSEVETVIEREIKDTFPSSSVSITWFKMPANSTQNKTIPVDEYTDILVITVSPVTLMSEVLLYYPNGTSVNSSANEQSELNNNTLKISIRNPEPGQWILYRYGADACIVNVNAHSALDFSASILEKSNGGNSYQVTGNPIKGKQYSVAVDIPNLNSNITCSTVALLCDSGTDVFVFNVTGMRLNGITRYIGDFIPANKSLYYIQVRGTDDKGYPFLRTRSLYIMPVSVQIHISPLFENLRLNEKSNISFSITKTAERFDDIVLTILDGNKEIDVAEVSFENEQVYKGVVMVTPTSLQVLILRILITRKNSTKVIQTKTMRYSVMDTGTVKCIVKQHPGSCPSKSRNTERCASYNWTGSVEVSSATIKESAIEVSTDEVILDDTDLTNANSSRLIIISGHCCIQTVVLTIFDKDGNFDDCSFIIPEQHPSTTTTITTTEKQTTVKETSSYVTVSGKQTTTFTGHYKETGTDDGNSQVIGISIGFTFLGLTLVGIIFCIVYRIKKRSFPQIPVFLNYRTLQSKDGNDLGANEMLYKCHELHSGDHVTTEDEINLSNYEGGENSEENKRNSVKNATKEQPEGAENKTPDADISENENRVKETNSDNKNLTSINPNSEAISFLKAKPESSESADGSKVKEDDKGESSSDHGANESPSTESNISKDSQNLSLEKGNDLDSQKATPDNSSPADKQENNENVQTTQVVNTGEDKERTEASSKDRKEEKSDVSVTNDSIQPNSAEEKQIVS